MVLVSYAFVSALEEVEVSACSAVFDSLDHNDHSMVVVSLGRWCGIFHRIDTFCHVPDLEREDLDTDHGIVAALDIALDVADPGNSPADHTVDDHIHYGHAGAHSAGYHSCCTGHGAAVEVSFAREVGLGVLEDRVDGHTGGVSVQVAAATAGGCHSLPSFR